MTLTFGLFGCGGMGRRHLLGMQRLQAIGRLRFELAAVCDVVPAAGQQAADRAAELLGRRPGVYTSFAELHRALPNLDAIIVTTAPDTHAALAVEALRAGVHVMVEKPIALTVRQGLRMVAAAREAGRKLAVAENYRRDPINRLARALIDAGALGRPFLATQLSSGGGESVIITPWRHLRKTGGIVIDMGIHYTDLLEYYLGPIESVVGMSARVDERRRDAQGDWHAVDAEDLSVGVARFQSGAIANWLLSLAGRGEGSFSRMIYGTAGSLGIPGDRSGQPLRLVQHGATAALADAQLLELVPDFQLDPTTAALFGGERLTSYTMPWADIDASLLAIEQDDFVEAILTGREPEVAGADGLRSLALVYGFLEAERLGRIVSTADLLSGAAHAYQDEIDLGD
jgi:predicted dehydrogenase